MTGPKSLANRINLRAIEQAVGGQVSVTATQNRHADEESASWALRIEGMLGAVRYSIENDGPTLAQLINDAQAVLVSLGIDIISEIDKALDEGKD